MNGLSPAFMARDSDDVAFKDLQEKCNKEKDFFSIFLKKSIESVEMTQKSRVLCESYKID